MHALKRLEALVSAKISVYKTAGTLFLMEAKLAELSILPFLLNTCMLLVILITVWFSLMCLLAYFIFLTSHSLLLSMGLIVLLNIGIFLGLLKYLAFNLKSMSFEKTREYFSQNTRAEHDQFEKKDKGTN